GERRHVAGVEVRRGGYLPPPVGEVDVAQVQPRNREAVLGESDRVAYVADEEQGAHAGHALSPGPQEVGGRGQLEHLELHLGRDGERHRRARQHVAGGLVVGDQDAVRVERRQPRLEHLAVHEPVVDADQGHARGVLHPILPRKRSDAWPIAFCPASATSRASCSIGFPAARSETSFSTMGRFTPVTTSTFSSVRQGRHSCVGDPPSRSVSSSTPSPPSTARIASSILWRTAGSLASTFTVRTAASWPTTPSAVLSSSSASFPCAA